jgi:hypothetical protein
LLPCCGQLQADSACNGVLVQQQHSQPLAARLETNSNAEQLMHALATKLSCAEGPGAVH